MSDNVQNIGSVYHPYNAKKYDARMGKRPYAPIQNDKDQHSSDNTEDDLEEQTHTTVSVSALILFIEQCLMEQQHKAEVVLKDDDFLAPWMKKDHSNSNIKIDRKLAVNAYKHAAEINRKQNTQRTSDKPEILGHKNLNALLEDLIEMQRHGIQLMSIRPKYKSFLDNVFYAVRTTKLQIKKSL